MKKYKSLVAAIVVVSLTLMTGCNSSEESAAGDIATENTLASQAASAAASGISDRVESVTDSNESIDRAELSKSKGTDQDVIVTLVPEPEQENVSSETKIEVTFSVPLDVSAIKEHDVKLTYLSSKTNDHIAGTISYSETDMKLTFTPNAPLEPGLYEVEIKSLKPTKAYKKIHIKEIKYRFVVVKEVLRSITVTPEQVDIKEGEQLQLTAFGHYDSGTERNITKNVAWSVANSQKASVDVNATLRALSEGRTAVFAKMAGVEANASIVVYKEMFGHRLPPEPDAKVNNATLLGIDSNDNGVRDDVERWIYDRYDVYYPCEHTVQKIVLGGREKLMLSGKEVKQKVNLTCLETPVAYHPIVREIAMQYGRATQIVIQEPEKALETMKYMDAVAGCNIYFKSLAEKYNEPILIDNYIFGDDFDNIQFNTAQRTRAYVEYNMVLSGGVYETMSDQEARAGCDFNITNLLQEGQ